MTDDKKIILGKVVSIVGLKGYFKCLVYSSNPTWLDKKVYVQNRLIKVQQYPYASKMNLCLCSVDDINNIDQAKELVNQDIWIYRNALDELDEDEFYFVDMIGKMIWQEDQIIDEIVEVHDFGAGTIFECKSGRFIHVEQVEITPERIKLN